MWFFDSPNPLHLAQRLCLDSVGRVPLIQSISCGLGYWRKEDFATLRLRIWLSSFYQYSYPYHHCHHWTRPSKNVLPSRWVMLVGAQIHHLRFFDSCLLRFGLQHLHFHQRTYHHLQRNFKTCICKMKLWIIFFTCFLGYNSENVGQLQKGQKLDPKLCHLVFPIGHWLDHWSVRANSRFVLYGHSGFGVSTYRFQLLVWIMDFHVHRSMQYQDERSVQEIDQKFYRCDHKNDQIFAKPKLTSS